MAVWHKKDIKIFLILVPIVNLINYFLTYKNISFNTFFLVTLLIDTLQGYLTWLIVRYVIIKLEKKSPLHKFTLKRLLLQLVYTSLVGLIFIITTTEIINAIARDTPVHSSFYKLDIWIYEIWILAINGVYIGIYYYMFWKNSEQKLQEANKLKTEGITVNLGNKNIKLLLNSITGIYVEDGVTYIIDTNNKTYIIDQSLDKLVQKLTPSLFFRVNRKFILHRDSITAFDKIENKKLRIITSQKINLSEELIVSRLKAPAFKLWFKQDSVDF